MYSWINSITKVNFRGTITKYPLGWDYNSTPPKVPPPGFKELIRTIWGLIRPGVLNLGWGRVPLGGGTTVIPHFEIIALVCPVRPVWPHSRLQCLGGLVAWRFLEILGPRDIWDCKVYGIVRGSC